MRKIVCVLYVFLVVISFLTGCYNDDDWAPYTHYKKKLDIPIKSQPVSIASLEEEITTIANNYDENTRLNKVIVTFKDTEQINSQNGIIEFSFYKVNDNKEVNQATNVILRFNMETNKVYEVEFEKGHGKKVWGVEKPIEKDNSERLFEDIYLILESNFQYTRKLQEIKPSLKYIFMDHRLEILLYDIEKNEGPVFSYEE